MLAKKVSLKEQLGSVIDELVERGVRLEQARDEFERQYLVAALRSHGGGLALCSQALGIHRNTLRNKIALHKISAAEIGRARRRS